MKKESSRIYKSSRQEYSEILRQKQEVLKEIKLEEERIDREDINLNFLFSELSLQETSGVDPDTILQVVDSLTRLVSFYAFFEWVVLTKDFQHGIRTISIFLKSVKPWVDKTQNETCFGFKNSSRTSSSFGMFERLPNSNRFRERSDGSFS